MYILWLICLFVWQSDCCHWLTSQLTPDHWHFPIQVSLSHQHSSWLIGGLWVNIFFFRLASQDGAQSNQFQQITDFRKGGDRNVVSSTKQLVLDSMSRTTPRPKYPKVKQLTGIVPGGTFWTALALPGHRVVLLLTLLCVPPGWAVSKQIGQKTAYFPVYLKPGHKVSQKNPTKAYTQMKVSRPCGQKRKGKRLIVQPLRKYLNTTVTWQQNKFKQKKKLCFKGAMMNQNVFCVALG